MTLNLKLSRRYFAKFLLILLDPTPTGSRTRGILFSFAVFAAILIASILSSFNIPIFKTRAEDFFVISDTSFEYSAIIGLAPIDRTKSATLPLVTPLEIICTKGALSLSFFKSHLIFIFITQIVHMIERTSAPSYIKTKGYCST